MAHLDAASVRGNVHILRDIYIPVKINVPSLGNAGCEALLGLYSIRDMDIAVAPVEADAAAGNQLAVIPDD